LHAQKLPTVSLAAVHHNIKTFVDHGLLRKVGVYHGSLLLENNIQPHHHLIRARCKAIKNLADGDFEPMRVKKSIPRGFAAHPECVDGRGVCKRRSRRSPR